MQWRDIVDKFPTTLDYIVLLYIRLKVCVNKSDVFDLIFYLCRISHNFKINVLLRCLKAYF